ncbi:hypothetical protein MRX96_005476 [Rhipicephalus microplus]
MTRLRIHDKFLDFDVNSGAACALISQVTFKATWTDDPPRLQTDSILLRTWSGQSPEVLGCATMIVTLETRPLHYHLLSSREHVELSLDETSLLIWVYRLRGLVMYPTTNLFRSLPTSTDLYSTRISQDTSVLRYN